MSPVCQPELPSATVVERARGRSLRPSCLFLPIGPSFSGPLQYRQRLLVSPAPRVRDAFGDWPLQHIDSLFPHRPPAVTEVAVEETVHP